MSLTQGNFCVDGAMPFHLRGTPKAKSRSFTVPSFAIVLLMMYDDMHEEFQSVLVVCECVEGDRCLYDRPFATMDYPGEVNEAFRTFRRP